MADRITVYYATNRNNDGSEQAPAWGERFAADGPSYFRVGSATVARAGRDRYGCEAITLEPEALVTAESEAIRLGSQTVFEALRAEMKASARDLILLIHGFASTFATSVERAAQIACEYTIRPADGGADQAYRPLVFLFSWPSNGQVYPSYHYDSDRHDAQASGIAMARALRRLIEFLIEVRRDDNAALRQARLAGTPADPATGRACAQRIHLLAHSMGNWALRHAVLALADDIRARPLPRLFEHVFLMGADEDADCFESPLKLGLLPDLARFVHVYHSADDQALKISDVTKANPDRLGGDGPKNMERIDNRIFAVDCGAVSATEIAHGRHQYYRLRREVIDDVRQVLAGVPLDAIRGRKATSRPRSFRILARQPRSASALRMIADAPPAPDPGSDHPAQPGQEGIDIVAERR